MQVSGTSDPAGEYVRRWVPEPVSLPIARIHTPWDVPAVCPDYPRPCVDRARHRLRALALYKAGWRS